ncbi:MAG TPA: hypothetical protein PLC61_03665 [Chitinophagales bacterium]|nr:hypothetical protein [Chitinophagales bacterium]HMU97411.1 hypothetical protein [Chitinophagales bacterium]HMV01998.1 hypothetical protein [Chitinophagales bacterium]HMW93358.1 hypothetical protein [Chitinophagales bacterium]HMY41612.1 hypothetical protein [Chitinophagales bacterium]
MKTVLFTAPIETENEVMLLIELLELGLDYLYIYKPALDDFSLVDFVEKIPEKYWKQCISNSLIITKEFDFAGYYFTPDILQKNELYNQKIFDWLKQKNKICATAIAQPNAIANPNQFQHIFVPQSNIKHSRIHQLIALDCSTISDIQQLKATPIKGIEISNFIWNNEDSEEAKTKMLEILMELNTKK